MKKVLGILLASAMMFSSLAGCSNKAVVVAKVNDIEIDSEELRGLIEYYFSSYYFEYNPDTATEEEKQFAESVRDDAIEDLIYEKVHLAKAKEDGLDQLTDEEKATIDEQVKSTMDQWYDYFTSQVTDEGELAGVELADEAKKRYNDYVKEMGYDEAYVSDRFTTSYILGKVQDTYSATIVPSDEQLQEQYQKRIDEEKQSYAESPGSYADDASPIYRPTGLKRVSHILVGLPEEVQEEVYYMQLDGDYDGAEALREEAMVSLKPEADAVYAQLQEEGADYEAIRQEVTSDKTDDEINQPEGYVIGEGTVSFVEEFVEAGMKLENVGDLSEPIASSYGYHILRLEENLTEETIAFEDVDESLIEEFTSYIIEEEYEKLVESWKEGMTIERFPEKTVYPTPVPTATPTASDDTTPSADASETGALPDETEE